MKIGVFSLTWINNLAYVVGRPVSKENLRCLITKREINIVNQTKWIYALFGHKSRSNVAEENFIGGFCNRRRPLNAALSMCTRKQLWLPWIINLCPMIYCRSPDTRKSDQNRVNDKPGGLKIISRLSVQRKLNKFMSQQLERHSRPEFKTVLNTHTFHILRWCLQFIYPNVHRSLRRKGEKLFIMCYILSCFVILSC